VSSTPTGKTTSRRKTKDVAVPGDVAVLEAGMEAPGQSAVGSVEVPAVVEPAPAVAVTTPPATRRSSLTPSLPRRLLASSMRPVLFCV